MQQVMARISGITPLMMHSGEMVNPLNPIVQGMKEITSKRNKTDEDYRRLFQLEFVGGMYHDAKVGPYIPGRCIWSTIRAGARLHKKGAAIERGLLMPAPVNRLDYKGPRTPEEMFTAGFADVRNAKPPGASGQVMRCRAIFNPPWLLTFSLSLDLAQMSSDELRFWTEQAGELSGLCDGRKIGMGRYTVEKWETL